METKTLQVIQKSPSDPLAYLYLNRPARHNALSLDFFSEFPAALSLLDQNPAVRVIVLSARGSSFCSGIDLSSIPTSSSPSDPSDPARVREHLRRHILLLQSAISAIERCRKPVIAEIDGACIGGGVDLVTACDVRYCTERAIFSVKEVDLAITADLGTLQRLPRVVGFGNAMEMALTGRKVLGKEAKEMGLVSRVFGSRTEMEEGVRAIAEDMATKSPLAVVGTKAVLLRSRDLTVEQGLDYVATWNSAMLLSDDLKEAVAAHINKRKPAFSKL